MSWMLDICSWGCRMRRTIKLWEVFVIPFEEALERHRLGRLSADEAGEALGMSGRQLRRLRVRYLAGGGDDAAGADGAVSGGVGEAALSRIAWPSHILDVNPHQRTDARVGMTMRAATTISRVPQRQNSSAGGVMNNPG